MKATTFGSALLLMLAGVCQAALAQEKSAPPRRAPPALGAERVQKPRRADRVEPPRNGQRGEKLRNFGGRLLESIAGDPNQQAKPLDVPKLNDGIVELLKPLFENQPTFESFKLGFDPAETNFAKDSVKLVASTRLKQSAWSTEPSQLDLAVAARIQRGEKGTPQARFDSQLTVATDVVPLANHAVAKYLERTDPERSRGGRASADGSPQAQALQAQVRERLLKTPRVSSMDDLVDLIVGLTALRLTTTDDRIIELSDELVAETDVAARQRRAADLAQARLERDRLFDVRPRVERDATGQAVAIHYTMDRSEAAVAGEVDRLVVAITAEQVTVDVAGTLARGMETYALIKPLVTNTLSRIQDRDPDTLRLGRGLLGGYLRQGREAVLDETRSDRR
ncbi:MAG TPA: hypothetical protein VMV69_14985 [Pirellulales bacterium]|nr:hypothetical protein [Pirellulales bacterium]